MSDPDVLDCIASRAIKISGGGYDAETLLATVLPARIIAPTLRPLSDYSRFDRSSVRRLVEDFWRELILFGFHIGATNRYLTPEELAPMSADLSRRFRERNEATATLMPADQAEAFLQMIDEEDTICFEEHQNNRDAFHRRLGLNFREDQRWVLPQTARYRRQSFGEMAARTAVRATIWESIYSLFRLFR
jgi:hypothetical protein